MRDYQISRTWEGKGYKKLKSKSRDKDKNSFVFGERGRVQWRCHYEYL